MRLKALGPFYNRGDLLLVEPRLLNRFSILEMHGGAVKESCRNIGTPRPAATILISPMLQTTVLDILTGWGALRRTVADHFPEQAIAGLPSDFKSLPPGHT